MCRSIKTLFNFSPPANPDDIRAAALQFVRKISGFRHPSQANQAAFDRAIEDISHASHHLLSSLQTHAKPRDRAQAAVRARARHLPASLPFAVSATKHKS